MKRVLLAIGVLASLVIVYTIAEVLTGPKIEVGQVWRFEDDNPFDTSGNRTKTVLAVSNGYVQYVVRWDDGRSCVVSAESHFFGCGATLQSKGQEDETGD